MNTKTLALYLGCEIQYTGTGRPFRGTKKREILTVENLKLMAFSNHRKLLLRPLSSMTEKEIMETKWPLTFSKWGPYTPQQFQHLLSKGFDLFGLIEKGEALDSTSQPEGNTVNTKQ